MSKMDIRMLLAMAEDGHWPAMPKMIAAVRDLLGRLEETEAMLFKLYNMTALLKYERDDGEPPPMRDGTYDRVMREVNIKLQEYTPR